MTLSKLHKALISASVISAAALTLTACNDTDGSSSSSATGSGGSAGAAINAGAGAPTEGATTGDCTATTEGVNWDALMNEDCTNLSSYNLFQDNTDPTQNPNAGGVMFDLTTPLFTDYASKYRFAFVPEGTTVDYNANEIFDFPVGTVLVKTFAMPTDTSMRDGDENVLETRLLIHREAGWKARTYQWDNDAGDATWLKVDRTVAVTTTHNGTAMNIDYIIPTTKCTSCHAVQKTGLPKLTLPIGPKARFLNRDYDYDTTTSANETSSETANQLTYWSDHGILSNLPELDSVSQAPSYRDGDEAALSNLTAAEVQDRAEAYLDINCAHCHRSGLTVGEIEVAGTAIDSTYTGAAGSTGLHLEYNREFEDDVSKFGICKTPVAGGHASYPADVVPSRSDLSYLAFRVETTDSRHKMPELGRVTTHTEGVTLVQAWIDNMDSNLGNCVP
jgi:uncharacterized repeat protein (TIGR03806 family)